MNEFWKFLDDNWFFIMIFGGGSIAAGGRRVAKYFNRSQQNRHELRMTRLQRQIGGASVEIVKPVCGCTHDLAFHNRETDECHAEDDNGKRCLCQRYVGPEPLAQIFPLPLTDLEGGTA